MSKIDESSMMDEMNRDEMNRDEMNRDEGDSEECEYKACVFTMDEALKAREEGDKINYNISMDAAGGDMRLGLVRLLFDYAIEDKIETILVVDEEDEDRYKTIGLSEFISSKVLVWPWRRYGRLCNRQCGVEWCQQLEALTDHIRSHIKIDYSPLIMASAEDSRNNNKGAEMALDKLLTMHDEDREASHPQKCEDFVIDLNRCQTNQGHTFGLDLLSDLYRYAMVTTEIKSVIYKGKTYYQRSNMWGEGPDNRPTHDPDVNCDFYCWDGECLAPATIFPDDPDQVKYNLTYDPSHAVNDEELFQYPDLIALIQDLDPIKIMLTGFKILTLINDCGENDDHRGSDHCQVDLGFYSEYIMLLPLSLMEFMEGCYRIKSHKWDKWYELYTGGSVSKSKHAITLDAGFDHGS